MYHKYYALINLASVISVLKFIIEGAYCMRNTRACTKQFFEKTMFVVKPNVQNLNNGGHPSFWLTNTNCMILFL